MFLIVIGGRKTIATRIKAHLSQTWPFCTQQKVPRRPVIGQYYIPPNFKHKKFGGI